MRLFTLFILFICSLVNAEERKLRFFALDMHSAVMGDLKNVLESLGHTVDFWTISYLSEHVFGRPADPVEIINGSTWNDVDFEMCQRFYEKYKAHIDQYDAFLVPHPVPFAAIFDQCNKPVIIINGVRYEIPFSDQPGKWKWLNNYLQEKVSLGKTFIVSNNKADQKYLTYYTDLESELIPSLCLYTNAKHQKIKNPKYTIYSLYKYGTATMINTYEHNLQKLPSYRELAPGFAWQDLYNHKAIIHFPYQISTMSLFEQYSANVPLFFPTKRYLMELYQEYPDEVLVNLSLIRNRPKSKRKGDLNNVNDLQVVKFWIDNADYYDPENMAYIQYFDSYSDLVQKIKQTDFEDVSRKMKEHNVKRKEMVLQKWKNLIDRIMVIMDN